MSNETTATENPVNAGATAATAPAQDAPDLGLQDLVTLKSIIDVASSRGAFKPNEMIAIGTTYSKLERFLEAAQKQSQAAQPQAAPNA